MGCGLVGAADYQDHPGAQGGYVPVVVLQSSHGGVVRGGYGIEGLAWLDLVMLYGGIGCRAGGSGRRLAGRPLEGGSLGPGLMCSGSLGSRGLGS